MRSQFRKIRVLLAVALLATVFAVLPARADDGEPQHGMGVLLSPPGNYPMLDVPAPSAALPSVVDWSAALPPVGDQGIEPTCTLWAVGYYYKTLQEQIEHKWNASSADHQFSPSYLYSLAIGCQSLQPVAIQAAMDVIKSKGAATLLTFPQLSFGQCRTPTASEMSAAQPYRALDYGNLFMFQGNGDVARLKAHLAGGDGFVLSVPIYDSFYFYHGAVPVIGIPAANERLWGHHAILVVGYDDSLNAFKFVNSWGTRWGNAGFGYLSYDFVRTKAWEAWAMVDASDSGAVVPVVTPNSPTPQPTSTPMPTPTAIPTAVPTATPMPTATPSPTQQPKTMVNVVLQQGVKGYRGTLDSYIDLKQPGTNYDSSQVLRVSDDGSQAALLRFDVSGVPANAEILQATLELYVDTYSQNLTLSAFEVVRAWLDREVDWRKARKDGAWASAGCNAVNADRAATATGSIFVTQGKMWRALDITTAVQHWVAVPGSNNGVLLRGQGMTKGIYGFVSSNHSSVGTHPKLTIKYQQ